MIRLDTSNALVAEVTYAELEKKLQPEIETMRQVVKAGGYTDDRASLNLVDDTAMLTRIQEAAKPFRDVDTVLLVGMGGPGLGAKAMQEALFGTLHNYLASPRMFYADTIDPTRIVALSKILATDLEYGKKVLIIVSTQSGTTTESIANMEYFLSLLESHKVDPSTSVVVITNEGSKLDAFSSQRKLQRILVPPIVGGRYSALSGLGLFPLAVMGVQLESLVAGAREARDQGLEQSLDVNNAARSAAAVYQHSAQGKNILVNFMLTPELESLGLWCRQVMAESLGKALDRNGKKVHVGITPTVAIGSRDLHSMFQLYMEGPNDKFTTFIQIQGKSEVSVPERPEFKDLATHIQGKTYQQLTQAISEGVLAAYRQVKRPYGVITIDDASDYDLGALMQLKMMETMFLGFLLNVNPFDQPGVEMYKTEMKRILGE